MTIRSIAVGLAAALAVAGPTLASDDPGARHRLEAGAFHWRSSTVADARADVSGVELRWLAAARRWSWSLAVPAVRVTGTGFYSALGPGSGPVGRGGPSGNGGPGAGASGFREEPARHGIGDVRLQVGHLVGKDAPVGRFDVHGGVKLPTADEEDGLGSGETDAWAGLGWTREGWNVDVTAFVDWVRLGDPEGVTLRDGAGGGVRVERPTTLGTFGLGLEAWPAVLEGDATRVLAVATARGRVRDRSAWSLEIAAGLTDSAPELGLVLAWRQGIGR